MPNVKDNTLIDDSICSEQILVVDDDPAQCLLLKKTLEKQGYNVLEATTGKQALAVFEQYRPVIVLLDAVMPEMDGYETCRRIRSFQGGKNTLIFMVTGLNDDVSVKEAFEAGADDFIAKPIYWSVLLGRLEYFYKAKISEQKIRAVENQLRYAQKMETIGNLTNGIAHNFNNILASILGYTDLLLNDDRKTDKNKAKHFLQQINQSANRAHDVVTQLQSFTSHNVSQSVIVNPANLLEETLRMLRSTLPASIELKLAIDADISPIKIAPDQFQQALMNLLINAREAMDNRGRIEIELKKVSIDNVYCASCHNEIKGDYIELSVKDTGTGIDKNIQDKIFDPYFSGRSFGEVSGMGLSVVHGIMHEYKGHVLFETTAGAGSVFKLLFAVTEVEISISDKPDEEVEEEEDSLESESLEHILIVDDEAVLGEFVSELLTIYGYKTTFVSNPLAAIEAVTSSPDKFDLVITDKTMPGLDGLELSGAIMAVREDLPVILCTGFASSLPDIDLGCVGIRAQLEKPVRSKLLLKTIKHVLGK